VVFVFFFKYADIADKEALMAAELKWTGINTKKILTDTGSLITGTHVVYTSGRHGNAYINNPAPR